ncbi:hypothetical protein TRAPUB_12243 [Trametes pubescens]|uniref:Uncharacterized protein n=1 Tax=Trametes pubescens TaxID=154538 RepID=A0A1M2VUG7_TRAPU|nr:hypothetical protein TRAPUB_12243 [Trametes pubescens]
MDDAGSSQPVPLQKTPDVGGEPPRSVPPHTTTEVAAWPLQTVHASSSKKRQLEDEITAAGPSTNGSRPASAQPSRSQKLVTQVLPVRKPAKPLPLRHNLSERTALALGGPDGSGSDSSSSPLRHDLLESSALALEGPDSCANDSSSSQDEDEDPNRPNYLALHNKKRRTHGPTLRAFLTSVVAFFTDPNANHKDYDFRLGPKLQQRLVEFGVLLQANEGPQEDQIALLDAFLDSMDEADVEEHLLSPPPGAEVEMEAAAAAAAAAAEVEAAAFTSQQPRVDMDIVSTKAARRSGSMRGLNRFDPIRNLWVRIVRFAGIQVTDHGRLQITKLEIGKSGHQ